MMEVVERNDVDISKIFNWGRAFEVFDETTGNVEGIIYMRLLGDADINRARVYALRESSKLRSNLKNPESDEYFAYLKNVDDIGRDDLIAIITTLSMRDVYARAKKSVKVRPPKQPKSDAPLEEMEKFQREVDEYPKKRGEEISEFVKKEISSIKTQLESLSTDELISRYRKELVNELCEQRALEAFNEMQVFLGCYKDSDYKERFFETFEEFQNLTPAVKKMIMDAYNSLEMDMTELKKLRRATP